MESIEHPNATPISESGNHGEGKTHGLSRKKIIKVLGGLFLALVLIFSILYILNEREVKRYNDSQASAGIITPTPSGPTPPPGITEKWEYKLRHYSSTDVFFADETYPEEVLGAKDADLISSSCTRTYFQESPGKYWTTQDSKYYTLTDPTLLTYTESIKKKYEEAIITEIYICKPEESEKKVVIYSLGPCGGGCSGRPYIGIVDSASDSAEIEEVATLTEAIAYFGCRKPLQFTKDGSFYFSCGGGDGPGASASVYKLSLADNSVSRISRCIGGIDESNTPYTSCN